MARPDSWMPVYWGDLWNKTRDLTAVEQCAYYNLLGSMWMQGGSLPNDNARLQKLSRVTEKEWRTVSATVTAYFDLGDDGRFTQKRLSEEYAKAMKAYTARSEHMANVNSKRKQSQPTVTVTTDRNTTHNSQSPIGDKHPSDVLGATAKRPTRIPPDWKPSDKDFSHASDRKLDPATIAAVAEQFRDHWAGASKNATSADWSAKWRTWVRNHIDFHGTGPWPRNGSGRSNANAGPRQSATAARDRILAKAGVLPESGGGNRGLRTDEASGPAGVATGEGFTGPIIDADEWERVPGTADGTEGYDAPDTGHNGRRGGAADGVPQTADGMACGRGAEGSDDPSGPKPVVAIVAGTEGASDAVRGQAAVDAYRADFPNIPSFLRRTA